MQEILHWYEHHWKQIIWLINISTTTYEVQKFISYTCLQCGGAGLTTPTPTPIDTEFWRQCEQGIFGINVIKICSF